MNIHVESEQGNASDTPVIAGSSAAVTLLLAAIMVVIVPTVYIMIKRQQYKNTESTSGPMRYISYSTVYVCAW